MNQNSDTDINDLHADEGGETQDVDKEWQESQDKSKSVNTEAVAELKAKYDELEDKYKRLWADQQNIVNRFNREKQEIHKYAASSTLESILPALDNFDFARKSITENTSHEEILKSINMLQEQLIMSLKAVGLEEVSTDIIFDPNFHEAVSNVKDPEKPEGTIVEVLKKGFKVNDRVLRPATVIVTTKE